ncbi:3-oxoacyl-[acyl-carrier-protein] reductase [Soehngenia longivitae]|uniref:3-oxoacyl-[acyl-carrier-protein] reductase n=1 Tax=Soehngenia longivitae TaxID=2562294 RepID=A0A4Z0D866_9FIRM|nr:3-oxoacyl-[acyl-carrier-protein] reductase [Soehngenia longivitae]TFZ41071.1 3-oxoacyl-[acyl-carrier-protein] reductase [Soehngenia longivitae]
MLNKKIALVTGGSKGIGKSIAIKLAEDGYDIAFTYSSDENAANDTLEELNKLGSNSLSIKKDMSIEEDVKEAIKEIEEKLGTVDVLVNNAGITRDGLLMKMKAEDFDRVIEVNLRSVFLTTREIIRPMIKKKYGKIINISSVVGIMGNAGQANYAASKAGVIGFTKSIAKEFASRGVRANAIAPGFVETDMTKVLKEDVKEEMLKNIPLGYFAKPEDVANLVSFLASEKSDYITGQVIQIDGGMNI